MYATVIAGNFILAWDSRTILFVVVMDVHDVGTGCGWEIGVRRCGCRLNWTRGGWEMEERIIHYVALFVVIRWIVRRW